MSYVWVSETCGELLCTNKTSCRNTLKHAKQATYCCRLSSHVELSNLTFDNLFCQASVIWCSFNFVKEKVGQTCTANSHTLNISFGKNSAVMNTGISAWCAKAHWTVLTRMLAFENSLRLHSFAIELCHCGSCVVLVLSKCRIKKV